MVSPFCKDYLEIQCQTRLKPQIWDPVFHNVSFLDWKDCIFQLLGLAYVFIGLSLLVC